MAPELLKTVASPSPHSFWSSADLVLYLLRFMSLIQVLDFGHIDAACGHLAKRYLKGRITRYTFPFFTKRISSHASDHTHLMLKRLFHVLEDTGSWIVGSVALAAASVLSDMPHPDNLNIITLQGELKVWLQFLVVECGFFVRGRYWSTGPYATAGRLAFAFKHPLISGSVSVTTAAGSHLGSLFLAAPNTDQLIAISAYQLITPLLHNTSEHRHIVGWRKSSHARLGIQLPAGYDRISPAHPTATTLDLTTETWTRPCGLTCPGVWRRARGLKGWARVGWGGMDGLDWNEDAALVAIGESRLVFRFGVVCLNPTCPNTIIRKTPVFLPATLSDNSAVAN
ncbi:hypothetical protein C8R46DRAFT_1212610 [Mycena filopes]|nr:hypothetical protein C8R46DRAFT_1212610 [Mycena filopes]